MTSLELLQLTTGFDALPSFDRINLGSTLLQCISIAGFYAALEGVARHFRRPAMRALAKFWRFVAVAAVLTIFSSWSGAIWQNRPLSRAITTVVVALLAASIPSLLNAARALASAESPRPRTTRASVQLGVSVLVLHAVGVFGSAALFPDLRVITVTWSRTLHFLVLAIPTVLVWRRWRVATNNRAAMQLLNLAIGAIAFRQAVSVVIGLSVSRPSFSFTAVLLIVVLDVLAILAAGVCSLLAMTAEEVSFVNEQSEQLARAQSRLAAAERMESLGRMASGVAHDVNNILHVIALCWETMRERIDVDVAGRQTTEQASTAIDHGRALMSQLLIFARARPLTAVRFDPAARLETITSLLRLMTGPTIELQVSGSSGGATLVMDPAQFEQVVINLVTNARDAMQGGGRITISLDLVSIGAADSLFGALNPGSYVRLTVEDTGSGISPDIRDRIFEPFFSTKEAGRGTGLGLATVHGIARQAAGDIKLESSLGHGSAFEVFLPAA